MTSKLQFHIRAYQTSLDELIKRTHYQFVNGKILLGVHLLGHNVKSDGNNAIHDRRNGMGLDGGDAGQAVRNCSGEHSCTVVSCRCAHHANLTISTIDLQHRVSSGMHEAAEVFWKPLLALKIECFGRKDFRTLSTLRDYGGA
jgi:hypothetical protein